MPTQVLYLGATGYIGGAVLVALLKEDSEIAFTALVRSKSDVPKVAATGARAIHEPLSDYDALAEKVAQVDIVFNTASSDDVPLNDAILKGLKTRFERGRGVGTLIHTSGTAEFADGTKEGKYDSSTKVWKDSEEDIRQITTDFLHGQVDVPILKAGEEGYLNTFIIAPTGVFGRGDGPVRKHDQFLLTAYAEKGVATYIGEGSNLFSLIHINDLVQVYKLVFARALAAGNQPIGGSPYSRFYNVTTNALTWKTIADAYARALYERGRVPKPEAISIPFEEAGPYAPVWAANMHVRTVQTANLGWEPKHIVTEETLVEGINEGLATLKTWNFQAR